MARYRGAECRQCRREKLKLFLKGDRCYSDKCAFERRSFAPGQHGQARMRKVSDYAIQLREKQKVRRIYGMLEGQFRKYFEIAERIKGVTGENLLMLLESRLDNVIYRLGYANSRNQGRQLVRHNHIEVNGRKVNIPSFRVSVNDVITLKEKSRKVGAINESLEAVVRRGVPSWLELDKDNYKGTVKALPVRQEITMPIQEQLIVELYSK
ncbi:MAG: 30S ribosomal protein S4 [Deltaproteobacteria bacterium]|uniref:30S ribosomal protein S4 n=1 Tax=Hydrosulfovibrio ferrireducens TaxID=2934181 RepID=UPI001225E070|nr:30S ribosomal protein S4 [Pseudomonadota bacterium]MCG2824070.1 30S ribosomal protein S4 [Desulfobulbaceae bacterium]MDP2002211.1 30S ribosomal protein S4 [Desulfurivibrionaceae bacterium]TDB39394.1 MAG: 30S ribosomal protein S4 [Deltaproteobacteria bacterium]MBU4230173.1 30S ribosomal protein S4 [Pseudomonadota bacterium]